MRTVMTIAGSDSGGGAGIQADLKTFAAHGVWGTCAIAAITAQNTTGVTAALPLPVDIIVAQIEAVASDFGVDAVKTGMLATSEVVIAVAGAITRLGLPNVVVDPVMVAKSGARLLADEAVTAVKLNLLPCATVVTPNAEEAGVLSGLPVRTLDDAREAARRIHGMGPRAVVVKGGHVEGPEVVDILYDGRAFAEFRGARIESRNTHGTGCTSRPRSRRTWPAGQRSPRRRARRRSTWRAPSVRAAWPATAWACSIISGAAQRRSNRRPSGNAGTSLGLFAHAIRPRASKGVRALLY